MGFENPGASRLKVRLESPCAKLVFIQAQRGSKPDLEIQVQHPSKIRFGNPGASCLKVTCGHLRASATPSGLLKTRKNDDLKSDVDFQEHRAVK